MERNDVDRGWMPRRLVLSGWRRSGALAALTLGVTVLVGGGLLAACGSPAAGGQSIVLYNGQHPQTTDALVSAFERATGINVTVRNGTEDAFAQQIVAEGARSPASVIYTEDSPVLEYLQSEHLLAKVDAGTLAKVPARDNSPVGRWVGVSARVSVLIYNPSLIAKRQLPTSVLGLANPKYKGKLAFAAGEIDFQPIVTAVDRAYGRARTLSWLDGIKANVGGRTYASNETIADEVNRGAVAFGVVDQYYWYRMRAQIGRSRMHSDITYFAPRNPGYVVDVSGAAVLRSAAHPAAAQKFLAFLVSRAGQSIIANPSKSISYEYPLGSGVTTEAPETPFSRLRPYPISVAQLGDGSTAVTLLQDAGLL